MNTATKKSLNRLELTVIPVKQPQKTFNPKGETEVYRKFVIKENSILGWLDDTSYNLYKRNPNKSVYWKIPGFRGYEFTIIAKLSI